MAELGTGWVSILPDASALSPGIKKALGEAEGEYAKAGDKGGKSFGGKFTSAAGKALKTTGVAAGAAGGAAIAAGMTKGIGRLNSIEQAEAKLTGLGNSASDVSNIMGDALQSVKGTSAGLEEAATTAAGMVASGIKPGKELSGVLTTVVDTATIAGTSMADMGTIFGSVAARGKLQGDDMLQLLSRGVPVLQLLADETGKTSSEISDMVSKGEIDFATFEAAMKRGMGGAAQEAGNTAEGALKNVGAAAGRLGATLAGPFFNQAAGAFGGVTDSLDTLNDRVGPVMGEFEDWLVGSGIPAMKDFASESVTAFREFYQSGPIQSAIGGTKVAFGSLVDAGRELAPVVATVGSSLSQAAGNIGLSGWNLFNTTLQLTSTVLGAVAGPLEKVANFMDDHPALVTAAVAAYAGFKTIPALMGKVATGIAGVTGASTAVAATAGSVDKLGASLLPIKDRAVLLGGSFKEAGVQVGAFARQHPEMSRMGVAMSALGQNVPMIGRMNAAYVSASSGLKTFGANQLIAGKAAQAAALQSKDLFTTVDRVGASAFRNASGHVASFAGTVSGVGGAALSGMKSAAKGVMDMVGGPWGAALAVGAGAVMMVADWQAKWNTHQKESEKLAATGERAYRSMFDTIAQGGSELEATTNQVDDLKTNLEAVGRSDPGGVSRFFKEIQLSAESAGAGIRTDAAVTKTESEKAWLDSADAAEKAVAALDNLGLSHEDVARSVNGSLVEYSKFRREVVASGEGGEELAQHLDKLRQANRDAASAAQRLGEDGVYAAQVIEELGQKANITADDVLKMNRALAGLRGDSVDATEAAGALTEQLTRAAEADWEFGQVTLKSSGSLDTTTQSGKDFYDQLTALTDEYVRSATASGDVAGEWERTSGTLYSMGEAAGLSNEDMDRLLTTMNLMPHQVYTQIDIDGDTAKMEMAAIGQQIADFKGSGPHSTEVTVKDEAALQALKDAGFELEKWDESTGVGTLNVDDVEAAKRFTWWTEHGFPTIDASSPTAKANLNIDDLQYRADYAQMQLDTIDLARPNPIADMDTDLLTEKQVDMLNRLGFLDGRKPTPKADLDLDQLTREEQHAIALLFDLSQEEAVPLAKLLGLGKFKGDTDAAKRYLNSIPDKKNVTISYTERRQKALADQGKPSDFIGPVLENAQGGRIPKSARGRRIGDRKGYRLPVTGPGTDREDGILGVGADGAPTSWVDAGEWVVNGDSSEKYDSLLDAINRDDTAAIQALIPDTVEGLAGGGRAGLGAGAANLTLGMDLQGILADGTAPFDPMLQSWQSMADTMVGTASSMVGPALDGVQSGVANTATAFTTAVNSVVNPAVLSMGNHLTAVKTALVDPALAGVRAGLDLTGQWFTNSVQSVMNPQWSAMAGHLQSVKDGSVLPTFGSVRTGLTGLQDWFSQSVGNMSTAFDRLKPGTGRPAKFVVQDVFNQGIRSAWNAVADLIDEKKMNPVGLGNLGQYASGGVLPGYTPGKDVHRFRSETGGTLDLSGGEGIMRPEWVRAVGGPSAVDRLNKAAISGNLYKEPRGHAYAKGGVLPGADQLTTPIQRSMMGAVAKAFPNQQITSGTRYADVGSGFDNHMQGRAIDFAPSNSLARWIAKEYPNTLELIHAPEAGFKNIWHGRPHSYDGPTMAQHYDHVHWAMASMVDPYTGKVVSMAGPGDGAAVMSMGEVVKGMWDEEIEKIPKFKGARGMMGAAVPKLKESMAAKAWGYLKEQADKFSFTDAAMPAGAGAERWRPLARKALARHGYNPDDHIDAMVQQIDIESSGDPNSVNNWDSNAAKGTPSGGLLHVIEPTYRRVRSAYPEAFAGLPDDRMFPITNLTAGVGAVRMDWGGPAGRWPTRDGYAEGGVLPENLALFDKGGMLKHGQMGVNLSGSDEPVFTSAQWAILRKSITSTTAMVGPLGKWVDNGISELERIANVSQKGWREWAAESEDRGRLGNPAEIAAHHGGQAAKEFAGDALSLVGLDGLADVKFSESFVDLVNAASDTLREQTGIRLGHIQQDSMQPTSVLDDDLRRAKTREPEVKTPASDIEDEPNDVNIASVKPGALEELSDESDTLDDPVDDLPALNAVESDPAMGVTAQVESVGTVEIVLEGDAFSADQVKKLIGDVNNRVGGVEVRVSRLESSQVANVTAGVTMLA